MFTLTLAMVIVLANGPQMLTVTEAKTLRHLGYLRGVNRQA